MCFGRKKKKKEREEALVSQVDLALSSSKESYEKIIDALTVVSGYVCDKKYLDLIKRSAKPEEETKRALIFPFLDAFGYRHIDGRVVFGERNISVPGHKKPRKVDYSIISKNTDNDPDKYSDILLEAKAHYVDLEKHFDVCRQQLADYFDNTKEANVGILSNGKKYFFFGCNPCEAANGNHIMAEKPFLTIDLSKPDSIDNLPESIRYLTYDEFDVTKLDNYTETLKPEMVELLSNTTISPGTVKSLREDIKRANGNKDLLPNLINDETVISWLREACPRVAPMIESADETPASVAEGGEIVAEPESTVSCDPAVE